MSARPVPSEALPERWPSPAPPPAPSGGRDWRRGLALVAAALALLAAAWFASPWWATWRLVQDARAGDARAVARRIDFPLVRDSLTPQIAARVQARLTRERARPHDFFGRLALMFAPAMAAPVVQVAVTPETVAQAIAHVRSPTPALPGAPAPPAPTGPGDPRPARLGYAGAGLDRDWDRFDAVIASRAHPDRRITLHLLRRGLFTWRLAAVDLPAQG